MKLIFPTIAVLLFVITGSSQTRQNLIDLSDDVIQVNTLERNSLQPGNKFCPVKGQEINKKLTQVIYNNKIIAFCCPGCDEAFLKNLKMYDNKLKRKDN